MKQLKLLLLITCTLVAWQMKGQNPPPSSFVTIPIGNQSLTNQSSSGSETWYKWVNDSTSAHVQLKLVTNGTNFVLANVELYALNTGSLELMNRDTIRPDSTISLWTRNLISGNDLYLRIVTQNTGCSTCGTPLNPLFNLQITNVTASCGSYVPSSCDLIVDGGMDNYWTSCNIGFVATGASYPGCNWAVPTWPSWTVGSTPDLYLDCAPTTPLNHAVNTNSNFSSNGLCTVGTNTVGAYAGANLFTGPGNNNTEYLYNHLAQPMQVGQPYHVSIMVRLSCFSKYAISNLAIYCTTTTPSQPAVASIPGYINPTAGQLVTFTTSPVSDKSNWVTLTACFTPTAAYNYATFGNFTGTPNYIDLDPSNTWAYSPGGYTANTHTNWAYYYFDNVSIKQLNVNATGGTTFCIGNSTQLNANLQCSLSNSYTPTYSWTPSTGLSATNISNPIASPTTTTIYTVTAAIPNANGVSCGITQTVAVIVSNIPVLTFSTNTPSICLGNTSTVTVAGALTYTWSNGATTSSVAVSPTVTTTYTVSGTNSCGYTSSATVNVVVVTPLTSITAAALTNSICPGGVATLQAFGASSYTWFPTPSAGSGSTASVHPNVTTTYTVIGSNNVCANTQSTTVTLVVMSPSVTIVLGNPCSLVQTFTANLNCNPSPQIYNFTWTIYDNTGFPIYNTQVLYSNVFTYTFTSTGVYTIGSGFYASTTGGSYGSSQTFTIVAPSTPTITTNASPTTICLGNSSTITASGASTYTWNPTGLHTASISVSPTVQTTYTVTGTNSCGLTDTKTVTINVTATQGSITATANPNPICVGSSATLQAMGAPNYTWTPSGAHTASLVVTPSVTTTYTVTGSNGCGTSNAVVTLTVIATPVITASINSTNLTTGSSLTLTAQITSTVNAGPYAYQWNPAITGNTNTAVFTPTDNAVYNCFITGACGSSVTVTSYVNIISTLCSNAASVTLNNATISSNTGYTNSFIDISGTLNVAANTILSFGACKVRMATNAKIVVAPTATLDIGNVTKVFSCGGMWYGIEAQSNVNSAAKISIEGSSTFEDAYQGIIADNANANARNPILLDLSTMNKNYTDISINNKHLGGVYTLTVTNSSILSQSTTTSPGASLKCSSYYTPVVKARGFAGIYANDIGVVDFTNGALTSTLTVTTTNLIKNKDYGLYFKKTDADVWNVNIKGMTGYAALTPTALPTGVGVISVSAPNYLNVKPIGTSTVTNCTFNNVGYGIMAIKTPSLDVQRCLFGNPAQSLGAGKQDVYTTDVNKLVRINYNTMSETYYPCTVNFSVMPTPATFSMSVSNNTITANGTSTTGVVFTGITINSATSFSTVMGGMVVAANTMTDVNAGVLANSVPSGLRVSGNSIYLKYHASQYRNGIKLANSHKIMVDNNTINGNLTGTVAIFNTTNSGILCVSSSSCFVQCNNITQVGCGILYNGVNSSNASGMFKNSLTYPIRRGLMLSNGGMLGTQGSSLQPSSNMWAGTGWLPSVASTDPSQTYVGDGAFVTNALNSKLYISNNATELPSDNRFFSPSISGNQYFTPTRLITTTATGTLTCAATMTAGYRVGVTTGTDIDQRNDDYSSYITNVLPDTLVAPELKWLLKQDMYNTIRQTGTGSNRTVSDFYTSLSGSNIDKLFIIDSLLSVGNSTLASANNDAMIVTNAIEQNQKDYNRLYITGATSSTDYATLNTLANLCPYNNGNSVYQARALLNMVNFDSQEYSDSCGIPSNVRMAHIDDAQGLGLSESVFAKLFPNPNNGNFMLSYDLKQTTEATVIITDITGKLVYENHITNMNFLLPINTSNLGSGLYFIKLQNNDHLLWTDKVMIAK